MEKNIESDSSKLETKQRPIFLKVLCILSFVGIGYEVFNNIFGLIFFSSGFLDKIQTILIDFPDQEPIQILESFGYFDMLSIISSTGSTISIIGVFGALICLVGVLQMWNMKKIGYYIYFVGEIGVPIAIASIWGASNTFLMMISVLVFIFPIAFVIMYGFNLKHMK